MSEAMSSVEIEDVLSSIRRLVSEDRRPASRTAQAKKTDEKLLLTPAFRVVAEPAPDVAPNLTPAALATPLPRLHLGAGPVIEKLAATLERAVEAQDVEWESEVGDPSPVVSRMEWTEAGWVPVQSQAAPPPAAPDTAPSPLWSDAEAAVADTALDGQQIDTPIPEPDPIWADRAEAEALAELRGESEDAALGANDKELTFDEEVLRDLVRDLIREELQGGLGERITRNVRKLVRAEIARALAAQDLD
jgi:hypothetical protein